MNQPAAKPALQLLEPRLPGPGQYHRINNTLILTGRWLLNAALILTGECAGLMAALWAAVWARDGLLGGLTPFPSWWGFLVFVWAAGAVGIRLVPGWGLGAVEELRRTTLLLTGAFAATTTALFLGKVSTEFSRLTLSLAFLFSLPLLPAIRMMLKGFLVRRELWGMPALVCGDEDNIRRIIQALREERGLGYIPVAACEDGAHPAGGDILGVPRVEDPRGVLADVAIVAMQGSTRQKVVETIEGTLSSYRHVVLIPDLVEAPSLWVKPRDVGGILGLEISSNLLDAWARLLKRAADLTLVAATAPVWIPLLLGIALAVWIQDRRGPVFRQERVGQHGRVFRVFKFRTMHPDAENILRDRLARDEALRAEWQANFKLRHDPRITPVGRFLRVTSLDELPQLLNVLRNEMSLVGPRPLPRYHRDELPSPLLRMRERVKPGLTGMWQVSGRSEAGNLGIIKWDAYYVRNWSIWLDIVILVRTLRVVLTGRGAF